MTAQLAMLYTIIGTQKEAEVLAHHVISSKTAACANIFPSGKSIYLWNDKIEESSECCMIFKTTIDLIDTLKEVIIQKHPYDLPCVLQITCSSTENFYEYIAKVLS